MSNMSYCRFQNTARDLIECRTVLEAMRDGEEGPLSREELAAAKQVARECWKVVELLAEHLGEEPGDLGPRALDGAVQALQSGADLADRGDVYGDPEE